MSKTYAFIILMTTLIVVLSVVGLLQGNTYELMKGMGITNNNLDSTGFSTSTIFASLFDSGIGLLSALAVTGGIIAGYIYSRDINGALRAGLSAGLGAWVISDVVKLYTSIDTWFIGSFLWIAIVIKALFAILFIGFIVALVLFATGGDN